MLHFLDDLVCAWAWSVRQVSRVSLLIFVCLPILDLCICEVEYLCIWTFVLKLALCIWRRGTLHIPLYRTIASHWWTFCLGRFFSPKKSSRSMYSTNMAKCTAQPFSDSITHSTTYVKTSVSSPRPKQTQMLQIWYFHQTESLQFNSCPSRLSMSILLTLCVEHLSIIPSERRAVKQCTSSTVDAEASTAYTELVTWQHNDRT